MNNNLPNFWEVTKIGNLASFVTGKLNSNAATKTGAYPFFTCSQETYRTDTYSFDTEAVLLAGNNANGVYPIKYYVGKFDVYQRTYVIRSKDSERLQNRFLFYALQLQLELLRSISTGAATKFLTMPILNEIDMKLPPIGAQRKIAAILSAYDDLIENNTRRMKILEEMTQMLYREWFVNFRFAGHEKVKMVNSRLGKVPEGWEVKQIGDVIDLLGGGTPSTKNEEYWEGGDIIWFSPSDLTANCGMFIGDSSKHITQLGLQKSSARLFPPYCVMMTSRATIGVVAINTEEACTNQGFIICIPNEQLSAFQIYYWIHQNLQTIDNIASGATYKEIGRGEFRELLIALPDTKTSRRFNEIIQPIGQEIENLLAENANLRRTRDLLLPKLISGEVDVSNLTIDVSKETLIQSE